MRVVHFAPTVRKEQDGVTRVLHALHEEQRRLGLETAFVTTEGDERLSARTVVARGLRLPVYRDYRLCVEGAGRLARAVAALEPDLVHLHSPCTLGRLGQALARRWGIPCVATYHTHFPSYLAHHGAGLFEPWVRSYCRSFYGRCAVTVVPSRALMGELAKDGFERLVDVPHGVDGARFSPRFRSAAWRQAMGEGRRVLLYVGRLVREKNLELLARAAIALRERRDDFVLVLIGDGPFEPGLRTLLGGTEGWVRHLGFRSGQELSTAFASADAFVFPSVTETFGNVTAEAMASGLACVVANRGGSADLVRDGVSGLTVSGSCHLELADRLDRLLGDGGLRERLAEGALESARAWTWGRVALRHLRLYEGLLRREERQRLAA